LAVKRTRQKDLKIESRHIVHAHQERGRLALRLWVAYKTKGGGGTESSVNFTGGNDECDVLRNGIVKRGEGG